MPLKDPAQLATGLFSYLHHRQRPESHGNLSDIGNDTEKTEGGEDQQDQHDDWVAQDASPSRRLPGPVQSLSLGGGLGQLGLAVEQNLPVLQATSRCRT